MNGKVYQLSLDQALEVISDLDFGELERHRLWLAARVSEPILVGVYDSKILCLVGFIPMSMLSESAYIWVHVTEAGADHKLVFARHALKVVRRALEVYPRLFGICFSEASKVWLRTLGAVFVNDKEFEIRRV